LRLYNRDEKSLFRIWIYVPKGLTTYNKTINGGISWQPAFNGINNTQVLSLAIDPQDPDVLYAGTSLDGVYKTEDGGQTWYSAFKEVQRYGSWEGIGEVLIDPNDSSHLYYANGFNLYETLNAGETWSLLGGRQTGSCPSDFIDILLDPSNGYLYTAVYELQVEEGCEAGVYRSKDGGENWDLLMQAPIQFEHNGLYMNPDHGEKIYALAHGDTRILYGSSDSGENWKEVCNDCHPLGVDESGEIIIHSSDKLLRSINGTSQFETFMQPLVVDFGVDFIVFNPHEADSWYFGSNYLRIAYDGGESTSDISSGLGASAFNIYIDKKNNAVMYARAEYSPDVYRSLDGGTSMEDLYTFQQSYNVKTEFLLNNEDQGGFTAYYNENNALKIFQIGDDWEDSYSLVLPGKDTTDGVNFISHPDDTNNLFLSHLGQFPIIYISTDRGSSWQESFVFSQMYVPIFHFSEIDPKRIYIVGGGNVFTLNNQGNTWIDCNLPEPPGESLWFSTLLTNAVTHPKNEDWLMAATLGKGIMLFENNCKTSKYSNVGLESLFVNSLVIDPNHPEIIYAGTEGGAFISQNGGQEWREINGGLLGANLVFSLAIDSQSNVYASTPYGIFILEEK
jgi:photosystem II stability/assembly factor-like uncharacterized protein